MHFQNCQARNLINDTHWTRSIKFVSILSLALVSASVAGSFFKANYPLKVINIKPVGTDEITAENRIFRAYPGLEYKIRPGVKGGLFPYRFQLKNAPAGMVIDPSTGEVTWSNPSGDATPTLSVRDQENTLFETSWTIHTNASDFIFIDSSHGNDSQGDGTQAKPFKSFDKILNETYGKKAIYFRQGTYRFSAANAEFSNKPKIWIAYPGEQVTIDMPQFLSGNMTNLYLDGMTFTNTNPAS